MKNLEDIPKNHPYKVPEGYFDRLTGVIQARIEADSKLKEPAPYFRYALQYALPFVVLLIVAIFYFKPAKDQNADSLLASVSTEELIAYLEESEMTTDELIESMDFDAESVEAIESEVYFNFDLDENNIDELNSELDTLLTI